MESGNRNEAIILLGVMEALTQSRNAVDNLCVDTKLLRLSRTTLKDLPCHATPKAH